MPTRKELWINVQKSLRQNLSKPSYETWISPAEFISFEDGVLIIEAPNSFSRNWLSKNYAKTIEQEVKKIYGKSVKVIIKAKEDSGINHL